MSSVQVDNPPKVKKSCPPTATMQVEEVLKASRESSRKQSDASDIGINVITIEESEPELAFNGNFNDSDDTMDDMVFAQGPAKDSISLQSKKLVQTRKTKVPSEEIQITDEQKQSYFNYESNSPIQDV